MSYDKNIHHKSSIRFKGYDYSSPGYYFITINIKDRECILGNVVDGKMILSNIGQIVHNEWLNTKNIRKNINLDEFIVMPNHVHMIIEIRETVVPPVWIDCNQSILEEQPPHVFGPQSNNLFAIIRGFKGATTKQINQLIENYDGGSIWQSRFYDHVIKTNEALENIRYYIKNNPVNWNVDIENKHTFKNPPDSSQLRKYFFKWFK